VLPRRIDPSELSLTWQDCVVPPSPARPCSEPPQHPRGLSIPARTAGVTPSPAGKWLNAGTDHAGRVRVQKDLTVPGHPEIFVVGDTASLDRDGKPLPGVAQVAMQQGTEGDVS
jgi:hypothetical protein